VHEFTYILSWRNHLFFWRKKRFLPAIISVGYDDRSHSLHLLRSDIRQFIGVSPLLEERYLNALSASFLC